MKILVTGGGGFIGSHITDHHLNKGDQVSVIDNFVTGSPDNLPKHPSLKVYQADLATFDKLHEEVKAADWIYHIAATVGIYNVVKKPADTLSNNIQTCELLLDAAAETQTKARLLITSSSGVYINSPLGEDGQFHETQMLHIPSGEFHMESYTLSKLLNEVMALSYCYQKHVDCVIARVFNTTGIRQSGQYGMVLPRLITQALTGEPLTVYGDGSQTRSFVNVHDVVIALAKLLANPKSKGEIFNVGNSRPCSILELAKLVKEKTRSASEITFVPYKQAYGVDYKDTMQRCPNIEKLKTFTGFEPTWTLEQTIDEMITYISAQLPQ